MIENVARSRRKAFHKINDSFLRNVLCETVWKLRTRSYSLLKRLLKRGGARKIVRERTGDEGSGAASWKLEESAEAFTFRLRKEEEKKKKRRRNYSKRNNELLIHRRQKAGVRIAFDVSLSFSLCTILSRRRRRRGRRIVGSIILVLFLFCNCWKRCSNRSFVSYKFSFERDRVSSRTEGTLYFLFFF